MSGVPSHDTFNRVFQAIDPAQFGQRGHAAHAQRVVGRGRFALGQLAVDGKSNEITAIPQLMDLLDLKGCVVTADALNTQKAVEKGADWLLPLKGNHPLAEDEAGAFMEALAARAAPGFESAEKGHGRIETRRCWQSAVTRHPPPLCVCP